LEKKPVLLISFYNPKALGIRYLEKSLMDSGHDVYIIFLKSFNSRRPSCVTQIELELVKDVVNRIKPGVIGLSVMSSLYLETVYIVNSYIRSNFEIPILWGGVYPTLFPQKCLEYADFVIRGEGEKAIVELADALSNNTNYKDIQNLAYRKAFRGPDIADDVANNVGNNIIENIEVDTGGIDKDETNIDRFVINDLRPLCSDLNQYGFPEIGGDNKFFINNNKVVSRDPQLNSISYELTTSRGCPFTCSYCSSINLNRLYRGKGKYVRFRSAESVINELQEAKRKIKNLRTIRFWDEIFPDDNVWIDEFTGRYKKEINLPFEIWVHPLKISHNLIEKLVGAGLFKAVMGIQSGSPYIRKEIFGRHEREEDIINASKILSECKVPRVIYDFILRHPFETEEDIRQSFELCMKLHPPFELQLHALNFFPGTDIVEKAIELNKTSKEKLEQIMYAPLKKQYEKYWGVNDNDIMINFWYSLIYMTQFETLKPLAFFLSEHTQSFNENFTFLIGLPIKFQKPLAHFARIRDYFKKINMILRTS
jgi:anaerobic magnesium-protoporphyrin IX monomethyl ester cyclase